MSFHLEPYNLLLFLAVYTGVLLTEWRLRRDGRSLVDRPWIILLVIVFALVGGRVHYLVEALVRGSLAPGDVPARISPLRGGSTFFGAMAGMVLGLVVFRRSLPYGSVLRLADVGVPGLALAIAIGRVGCLLNGCCLGVPTALPWAVDAAPYRHDPDVAAALARLQDGAQGGDLGLHPLVVYIGLWSLVSGALAMRPWVTRRFGTAPGVRVLTFGALFAAGRFLLETLRLPPGGGVPTFNAARWESLLLIVALGGALLLRRRSGATTGPR